VIKSTSQHNKRIVVYFTNNNHYVNKLLSQKNNSLYQKWFHHDKRGIHFDRIGLNVLLYQQEKIFTEWNSTKEVFSKTNDFVNQDNRMEMDFVELFSIPIIKIIQNRGRQFVAENFVDTKKRKSVEIEFCHKLDWYHRFYYIHLHISWAM